MNSARRAVVFAALGLFGLLLAACDGSMADEKDPAAILLFNGDGASHGSVAALEDILRDSGLRYATANSQQQNAMALPQLQARRLLIIPGGNFEKMGNGLAPETSANIREAVAGGLNYLGVCAGAFFVGNSPYNGLNLTGGVMFKFYALEAQGVRKSAVAITSLGLPARDHYWEDGPELSGWGDAVARYPDGTPAVAEGAFGKGWMVLTGIHAEAPESWRRGLRFATPIDEDKAYAADLIRAALNGTVLADD